MIFLCLPYDIRHIVYEIILDEHAEKDGEHSSKEIPVSRASNLAGPPSFRFVSSDLRPLSLLLCCKQVAHEMRSAIMQRQQEIVKSRRLMCRNACRHERCYHEQLQHFRAHLRISQDGLDAAGWHSTFAWQFIPILPRQPYYVTLTILLDGANHNVGQGWLRPGFGSASSTDSDSKLDLIFQILDRLRRHGPNLAALHSKRYLPIDVFRIRVEYTEPESDALRGPSATMPAGMAAEDRSLRAESAYHAVCELDEHLRDISAGELLARRVEFTWHGPDGMALELPCPWRHRQTGQSMEWAYAAYQPLRRVNGY